MTFIPLVAKCGNYDFAIPMCSEPVSVRLHGSGNKVHTKAYMRLTVHLGCTSRFNPSSYGGQQCILREQYPNREYHFRYSAICPASP